MSFDEITAFGVACTLLYMAACIISARAKLARYYRFHKRLRAYIETKRPEWIAEYNRLREQGLREESELRRTEIKTETVTHQIAYTGRHDL